MLNAFYPIAEASMRIVPLLCAALALIAAPLAAQIALPRLPLPPVGSVVGDSLGAL